MRERELEKRQMELAKIATALGAQKEKLQSIIVAQEENIKNQEIIASTEDLDILQLEAHRSFGAKLISDAGNQERIIANTESILEKKRLEVNEAHKKVEVLKKLKEKQEKEYYQEFLKNEMSEIDDITTSRFKLG